jgi:hypothetical protein
MGTGRSIDRQPSAAHCGPIVFWMQQGWNSELKRFAATAE